MSELHALGRTIDTDPSQKKTYKEDTELARQVTAIVTLNKTTFSQVHASLFHHRLGIEVKLQSICDAKGYEDLVLKK